MKPCLKLLLLVFIVAIIPACKKDKAPDAGGNTLDKITRQFSSQPGVTHISQYQYDGANRLVLATSSSTEAGSGIDSVKFVYDAGGRMTQYIQTNSSIGGVASYTLQYDNNGRITRARGTALMVNLQVDDHLYAYDAQGRLVADSQLIGQNGAPSNYHKYQYDAAGNVVKDDLYDKNSGTFQIYGTSTYTFDDHPNPTYSNNGMALYMVFQDPELLSKNNAASTTSQTLGSAISYNMTVSYSYYSNGYPRHASATFSGTGTGTATGEYYYKAP